MTITFFDDEGVPFELYFSKVKHAFRVRVAEDFEEWDFDNVEHARDMTADLKGCKSYDEACEILGVGS